MTKKIELDIGGKDYEFNVDLNAYNGFIDGAAKGQVAAAAYNFASITVKSDQRDELLALLDQGLAVEIAQPLAEEFKPAVKIAVKKSNAA